MRLWLVLILIVLLPLRVGAADFMALQGLAHQVHAVDTADTAMAATQDTDEVHAFHDAAGHCPEHAAGFSADDTEAMTGTDACGTCSACQVCHSPLVTGEAVLAALVRPAQPVPATAVSQWHNALLQRGQKPPIS